jgi:uncharacterized protein
MTTLHRILRKPFFGRFEVPWVWPQEEEQRSWERVSFMNPSGATLAGLWGTAYGQPVGTLVLAHPMGKAAKGFWLNVGLIGASFGAGWGLCAMAREGNPFKLAVLEAAFPTLPEFWKHYPVAHAALKASQIVWPGLERRLRPEREAAKVLGHPSVLLMYGDKDTYTPPEHGHRLLHAFSGAADAHIVVLPGVDHTFAFRDASHAYTDHVMPFLSRLRHRPA